MTIEIIINCFTVIGAAAVLSLIAFLIETEIKPMIKDILNHQSKIKFLCKHEFEKVWEFEMEDSGEKYLIKIRCAKCGKTKKLVFKHDPQQ